VRLLHNSVDKFKLAVFGRKDIILHTADITRNRKGFENLKDKFFREHFYNELNLLIADLQFTVIACVIRKDIHLSRYGVAALDPYFLSLDILIERFCMEIGDISNGGVIVAERRDPILDHELELAWLNLKVQGTRYMKASQIEKRIIGLNLRAKSECIAGLELADLVVTPIGRYVLGKSIKEDFKIIKTKLRRSKEGEWRGYGLVILPK
jgi:hypothetical protein